MPFRLDGGHCPYRAPHWRTVYSLVVDCYVGPHARALTLEVAHECLDSTDGFVVVFLLVVGIDFKKVPTLTVPHLTGRSVVLGEVDLGVDVECMDMVFWCLTNVERVFLCESLRSSGHSTFRNDSFLRTDTFLT